MDTDTPNLPLSDSHVDWRYEMRREMQLIVPGLWLGPFSSAKNEANLKRCGITHIVCVRDGAESRIIRPLFPSEFVYLEITASDSPFQNLIPLFPQSKLFIDSALGKGGVVFVHCNGGISMAPAFVIAYLMETYLQDYQHAFEFVQTKRFCMNPNEGFKLQLKEYEPIFAARAAFQAFPPTHHQLLAMRARRRPAPTDDDEVDEIGDDTRQEAFMAESKFGGGRDPRFEKPMGRP